MMYRANKYHIKNVNILSDFGEKKYDTLFCLYVLEHIADWEIALKKIAAHLRPNGQLIECHFFRECDEDKSPQIYQGDYSPNYYLEKMGFELKEIISQTQVWRLKHVVEN